MSVDRSRLPQDPSNLTEREKAAIINRLFDSLVWSGPLLNPELGTVEPPAEYRFDGMLVWADGTNWNPGWGKGLYVYKDGHWEGVAPVEKYKSYHMRSKAGASGIYYSAGYYDAPAADANLTQASATQAYGSANAAYAAHAFIVAGAAGSVDAGQVGIRVTGTSITDAGVRTTSDSEVLSTDITSLSTDQYLESSKKWLGTVTFELYTVSGSPTTYSLDFNYGFCKYDDIGNNDFTIKAFECVGYGGANDPDIEIELIHHKSTGWTYHATAFVPGPTPIVVMSNIHSTDDQMYDDDYIAFKRTGLDTLVDGNGSEGFLVRTTTTVNKSIEFMDIHVGYH